MLSVLSARAAPLRRLAMGMPRDGGRLCRCAAMARGGARPSGVSRHVATLRTARRAAGRRDAQWRRHRLRPGRPARVRRLLGATTGAAGSIRRKD